MGKKETLTGKGRLLRILFLLSAVIVISVSGYAIRLPEVFSSHMVLQRNTNIDLRGWGDAGETITLEAGWLANRLTAVAGADGFFQFTFPSGEAGGPYEIRITGNSGEIILEDILLGDVWIASGQSNMDFTLNMLGGWNKTFPLQKDELMKEKFESIRLFDVAKDTSSVLQEGCKGTWKRADTLTVSNFSASAWFFGVEIYRKLGIPVGLISSAWGGTAAEAWTPREIIEQDPALAFYRTDPNRNSWFPTNPGVLFNAMIYPLTGVAIKGVIWYQGESNVTDANSYDELFPAMIRGWRQAWGRGDFPFYYVQIAPFTYERAVVGALLREAQLQSLGTPETGMAVTMDITDDVADIHPKDKVNVGRRLALWALAKTYGFKDTEYSGPVLKKAEFAGKYARLYFDHAESGLKVTGSRKMSGFFIAGSDRRFIPANVRVEGNMLLVSSPGVREAAAVRYAFTNTSVATLFNGAGLPASSFRTDDWPLVTDIVTMKPVYESVSDLMMYELTSANPVARVAYSTDGTEPDCRNSQENGSKVLMNRSGRITVRACVDGIGSESIGSWEINCHKGIASSVDYAFPYSGRYPGGGDYGLVDGLEGSMAFYDGAWQGFEGDDLSLILDLGTTTLVRQVKLRFYSDPNSWIFAPRFVEISTSSDGVSFEKGFRSDNISSLMKYADRPVREIIPIKANIMKNTRYIKVVARNIGVCPRGHIGEGDKAWLFVDEIELE